MRNEGWWFKSRTILYTVLVHLAVLAVFLLSFNFGAEQAGNPDAPSNAINAESVDDAKVMDEMLKLKAQEQKKQQEAEAKKQEVEKAKQELEEIAQKQKQEKETLKEIQKNKEEQQKKAQEAKKQLEEEQKNQIALLKKKQQEEKQELEKIQKEKAAAKEQAEKEKKEKEEKEKAENEAKEKKERIAKEKKEAAEKAKKQREEELEQQLEAEAAAASEAANAEHAAKVQRAGNAFIGAVSDKVRRLFEEPQLGVDVQGLSCLLRVKLDEQGNVLDVEILESSGYELFDGAAQRAVFRATPLPIPQDPELFDDFRSFRFRFKPQGAL